MKKVGGRPIKRRRDSKAKCKLFSLEVGAVLMLAALNLEKEHNHE